AVLNAVPTVSQATTITGISVAFGVDRFSVTRPVLWSIEHRTYKRRTGSMGAPFRAQECPRTVFLGRKPHSGMTRYVNRGPADPNRLYTRRLLAYQTTFSANWICRAGTCVATIWPNCGLRCPFAKIACMAPPPVLALSEGGAKLARFKILNISARNCTLKVSEMCGM